MRNKYFFGFYLFTMVCFSNQLNAQEIESSFQSKNYFLWNFGLVQWSALKPINSPTNIEIESNRQIGFSGGLSYKRLLKKSYFFEFGFQLSQMKSNISGQIFYENYPLLFPSGQVQGQTNRSLSSTFNDVLLWNYSLAFGKEVYKRKNHLIQTSLGVGFHFDNRDLKQTLVISPNGSTIYFDHLFALDNKNLGNFNMNPQIKVDYLVNLNRYLIGIGLLYNMGINNWNQDPSINRLSFFPQTVYQNTVETEMKTHYLMFRLYFMGFGFGK